MDDNLNATDYSHYMKNKEASKALGVTYQTLHRWSSLGKLKAIRTPGNVRLYDVDSFLRENNFPNLTNNEKKVKQSEDKKKICYCRVSTKGQGNDLQRQIALMKEMYPDYEIIKDIGSGINFRRTGLLKIIDLAIENKIEEIVVAYKDRLSRIGFELIEYIVEKYSNGKITIMNNDVGSPEEEVVKDLLQILNVFGAKVNGLRKYKNRIKSDHECINNK